MNDYSGHDKSLEVYKTYREMVVHEDNLINFRLTWLLIVQGASVSGYVAASLSEADLAQSLIRLIPPFGAFFAVISWLGVVSASVAIRTLQLHYLKHHDFDGLPPLTGGGIRNIFTNIGVAYHLSIPLAFILGWSIIYQ